jgi:hypothetical protein
MKKGTDPFADMTRCSAKTRAGTPCKRIGNSRNHRCILHGGRAGAPVGSRNGRWRHGNQTEEAKAQRQSVRALLSEAANLLRDRT